MVQIFIPFKERFREPMLKGVKTMTSRTKCYGRIGDWFNVFGQTFVLTSVVQRHFDFIADHWVQEGCASYQDFIDLWRDIHPRRPLDMTAKFWTHTFTNISSVQRDAKQ